MARPRKNSGTPATGANPPRVVIDTSAPPVAGPPTPAARFASYARTYPERVPVLPDEGRVLILSPLGFYESHDVREIRGVTRRALRDSAKALHREMLAAAVPLDWKLPEATRYETDGARGLAAAPEATEAPEATDSDA